MPPVEQSLPERAPYNRLAITRERPDTLRISGWLDLREPVVLTTPDTHGRYFVLWLRDPWDTVFATVGARTTGTAARAFVLLGPGLEDAEVRARPDADHRPDPARRGPRLYRSGPRRPGTRRGLRRDPAGRNAEPPAARAGPRLADRQRRSDRDELAAVRDADEDRRAARRRPPVRAAVRARRRAADRRLLVGDHVRPRAAGARTHSVGDLYGPRADADGSIAILVQHEPPARRCRSNWLPVPLGDLPRRAPALLAARGGARRALGAAAVDPAAFMRSG